MKHEKTFDAIIKLKDIQIELHRLKNALEMANRALDAQRAWVGLTLTQVKLLWEGVQEEAVKSGDSLNWVFYTHINEALKEKNNAPKRIQR